MKNIQNIAAAIFVIAVAVLSVVSVFGVWEFFERDVITKSFQTLGLLAVVAVVVMVAGRFVERRSQTADSVSTFLPSPLFKVIRRITLIVLIISVSILALLGVLAIWEVVADKDILYKSISSLAVLAFGAFVIVMMCLEREKSHLLGEGGNRPMSGGGVVLALLVALYLVFVFISLF